MNLYKIIFLLLFFCSCLQAKKSPFDVSSPSGIIGIGGFQFFFGNSQTNTGNSSATPTSPSTSPPTVTSISTSGGGTGVQFTFSKAMTASSITVSNGTGTFQMLGSDSVYLNGTITTSDNKTFAFKSATPLTVNLAYTIKILKSAKDSTGLAMNEDYVHGGSLVVHKHLGSFGTFGNNANSASNLGQFNLIPGVAVDSTRNFVYMTDHSNQRVQAFNQTTSAFSSVVYATSGTPNMFGIAVDSSTGNIFYSESNSGIVKRLDYPGWGAIPVAGFSAPRGIALDSAGNVYIAERNGNKISKYTNGLVAINPNFITGLNSPSGIAIDSANNIYIANEGTQQVKKYDSIGVLLTSWGSAGSGNGQLNSPIGIAVDSNGYVYVAEWGNNRIQKFDSTGNFILVIGGPTAGSGVAQFSGCTGVAVDSTGNVYVADQNNNRVQKFGPP